ncbi:MAG TPA: TIM barrel protein [Thermoguttaceae bacterium]
MSWQQDTHNKFPWCCQKGHSDVKLLVLEANKVVGTKLIRAKLVGAKLVGAIVVLSPLGRSTTSTPTTTEEQKETAVFVAATSRCFPDLPLDAAMMQLADLEYTSVEIMIHESGGHLRPSAVLEDLERAVMLCRQTHRLTPVAFSIDIEAPDNLYYRQFAACCKLAKAVKIVTLTVRSAELGTPFNAEVERLRELVSISSQDGIRVGLLTETGRMTQDPDTAIVLCDNVKGLGITLDPSYYVNGPLAGVNYEQVMKYVYHLRLRDTNKSQLQVRVGQGEVEYGRLVNQLHMVRYDRALCVDIFPIPDEDHLAEMRKMRLLLESLL